MTELDRVTILKDLTSFTGMAECLDENHNRSVFFYRFDNLRQVTNFLRRHFSPTASDAPEPATDKERLIALLESFGIGEAVPLKTRLDYSYGYQVDGNDVELNCGYSRGNHRSCAFFFRDDGSYRGHGVRP